MYNRRLESETWSAGWLMGTDPSPVAERNLLTNPHQAQVDTIYAWAQMGRAVKSHPIIVNLQGYLLSLQTQADPNLLRAGISPCATGPLAGLTAPGSPAVADLGAGGRGFELAQAALGVGTPMRGWT
jgi:hypothetical protein